MLPCSSFRTVVSRNLLNLLNLIHGTTLLIKESFSPLQIKTMSSKKSTQNMSPFRPLCLIYLTVILRGRAGYQLIYITNEAVGRVGYYQLISGKSERNNCFSKFLSQDNDFPAIGLVP